MKKLLVGGALSALLLVAAPVSAATIVSANSANIDAGGPGFGSIADTHNKSGLSTGYTSGVTDFDTYIASDPKHTNLFAGFEWFSTGLSAQVTYDLGMLLGIDRLALWNEESSGIGSLALSSSVDGITFASLGNFNPTPNPLTSYSAQVFSFAATNARYVRFGMTGCPNGSGTFQACAIGEVAFRSADVSGAVPEPSTWALILMGFAAVGAALRSKRRKSSATASFA